jgi:hypothetical protein
VQGRAQHFLAKFPRNMTAEPAEMQYITDDAAAQRPRIGQTTWGLVDKVAWPV